MLPQVSSWLLPNVIRESTSQITVMTSSFDSTSNNGLLSTMATSLQRPRLYFVPADSPYINSYLNLSTTATSPHRQRPLKRVPNCQNNPSTNRQFFQRLTKKSRMVMILDPYGGLMINRDNRICFIYILFFTAAVSIICLRYSKRMLRTCLVLSR